MDTDKVARNVAELKEEDKALAIRIEDLEEEVSRIKKDILDLTESAE